LVKKELWGGEFWTDGYYISTVGKTGTESVIQNYVKKQGKDSSYSSLHQRQLKLFDGF